MFAVDVDSSCFCLRAYETGECEWLVLQLCAETTLLYIYIQMHYRRCISFYLILQNVTLFLVPQVHVTLIVPVERFEA